jgi:hypothetical protein
MNCHVCKERLATVHVCNATTGKTQNLCPACYETTLPPDQLEVSRQFNEAVQTGNCDYCGAPAAGGSGSWIPFVGNKNDLWCEPCRLDLVEFHNGPGKWEMKNYPFTDPAARERIARELAALEEAKKKFMREKIAARR